MLVSARIILMFASDEAIAGERKTGEPRRRANRNRSSNGFTSSMVWAQGPQCESAAGQRRGPRAPGAAQETSKAARSRRLSPCGMAH